MNNPGLFAIGLVISITAHVARADIHADYYDANGEYLLSDDARQPGQDVDIALTGQRADARSIIIYTDTPASEDIGRVLLFPDSVTSDVTIYVARPIDGDPSTVFVQNDALYESTSQQACRHWQGLDNQRTSSNSALKAAIAGDLSNSLNSSNGSSSYGLILHTLQVAGKIKSSITAAGGVFNVVCGSIGNTPNAPTIKSSQNITSIVSTQDINVKGVYAGVGDFSGAHRIDWLESTNGKIGVGSFDPEASAVIGSQSGEHVRIGKISAKTGIGATIRATDGIGSVTATNHGSSDSDGAFLSGMLIAPRVLAPPDGDGVIDVAGNLTATITLSEGLPVGTVLRVGGDFGITDTATVLTIGTATSSSPGLGGQVIVGDAEGIGYPAWGKGKIVIKQAGVEDVIIGRTVPPPGGIQGWFYHHTAAELGGGSVGLVPFAVNLYECAPPGDGSVPVLLQSDFYRGEAGSPILLRFYGPVQPATQPFRVERVFDDAGSRADVTSSFVQVVHPGGAASERTVSIVGKENTFYYPGLYVIRPNGTDPNDPSERLLCDVSSQVPVASFEYQFYIRWDCNNNGTADAEEIANDTTNTLDPNGDGLIDDCDRFGGCLADFDGNGWVNGNDVDLFTYLFTYGVDLWADINQDGFLNGEDMDAFGAAFEAGC